MKKDTQMIHEIIMIMNNNQCNLGKDNNKTTIIKLEKLLQTEYGLRGEDLK